MLSLALLPQLLAVAPWLDNQASYRLKADGGADLALPTSHVTAAMQAFVANFGPFGSPVGMPLNYDLPAIWRRKVGPGDGLVRNGRHQRGCVANLVERLA